MKMILTTLFLSISFSSFGALVTSHDKENNCTVYRNTEANKSAEANEVLFDKRPLYGMTLRNMTVDFENQMVKMQIIKKVVLGFDRPLFNHKLFVKASNPNFNFLINQLNREIFTFNKVCITDQNELLWAHLLVDQK